MLIRTSLVSQIVKNLPSVRETQVLSLGQEDPLEKGMATHSSLFLHGLESNPGSSLQTEEEAGLP